MDLQTLLAILGGLLSIAAAAVALARFFTKNQRQLDSLQQEIKSLQVQNQSLQVAISSRPEHSSTDAFKKLTEMSAQAANAIGAEIHSVSMALPFAKPSYLKIIHSTDPQASRVVGREIPMKSIAGWVFENRQYYYQYEAQTDSLYFAKVDEAAGADYRKGAILTLPLLADDQCRGVIQFMKSKGGAFSDRDARTAAPLTAIIARQLVNLELSREQDIPSIARGNYVACSVLFTDIRGYSKIASEIPLGATVALLNEYYSRLLPLALANGGKLREYFGDGLYAAFVLDRPAASANAAVMCALEMQKEYARVMESWLKFGHPVSPENFHNIGITSGSVYSGLVGHESDRRDKLVGPPVNLAYHLCNEIKHVGGGIVICQETANLVRTAGLKLQILKLPSGKHYQIIA